MNLAWWWWLWCWLFPLCWWNFEKWIWLADDDNDNDGFIHLISVDGKGDSEEENKKETAALQVHPARAHPEVKWDINTNIKKRSSARWTNRQQQRLVQVYKSDVSDLQSELEAMRKALDRERIRGGELEAKLASLDQDMAFQLQVGAGYQIAVSLFTNSQPSH